MLKIEHETMLAASPSAVWQILMDFPNYAAWHPYIRLIGKPIVGEQIGYSFTSKLVGRRALTASAQVSELKSEELFSLRTGLRPLLIYDERYHLRVHPTGTHLYHSAIFSGWTAHIWTDSLTRQAEGLVHDTDAALRAHVSRLKQARSAVPEERHRKGTKR